MKIIQNLKYKLYQHLVDEFVQPVKLFPVPHSGIEEVHASIEVPQFVVDANKSTPNCLEKSINYQLSRTLADQLQDRLIVSKSYDPGRGTWRYRTNIRVLFVDLD